MFRFLMAACLLLAQTFVAAAHEVRPAIADLSTGSSRLVLDLQVNAEALIAGIDLEGVENTDETDGSDRVDALRGLPPEALADALRDVLPSILGPLRVEADGTAVALSDTEIEAEPVGDVDLARDTRLRLEGNLPRGAATVEVFWPARYGGLILRQQGVDEPFTGLLQSGQSSGPIQIGGGDEMSGWQAFGAYIPVGFDHILPKGLDHILFVLGLFFLSMHLRPLLWQVSAFTLAHTVTLALGALGLVRVAPEIVEPIIAASIVYVAVENILTDGLSRTRPFVVFGFGLLHGLGFASVLGEFGLPTGQFIPALIGFNIGVELGQLTVIAIAFLLVGYWFGSKDWYRKVIAVPASTVIALVGSYWFVERVFL